MWIQKKLWWHPSPPILGEAKPNFGSYNYHKDTPPIFHLNSTHKNAAQIPQSESDWQIKAQYLSPVVVRRAHWGVALSPLWHITWAAALAVALGTAEISGQSLHTNGFLIGFAASLWVAVVSGVGCHSHLQHAATMEGKNAENLYISWKFCFKDKMRKDFNGYMNPNNLQ